jgi:hypothetical protein
LPQSWGRGRNPSTAARGIPIFHTSLTIPAYGAHLNRCRADETVTENCETFPVDAPLLHARAHWIMDYLVAKGLMVTRQDETGQAQYRFVPGLSEEQVRNAFREARATFDASAMERVMRSLVRPPRAA